MNIVSLKGKNRIREHGDRWKQICISECEESVLLESVQTKYRQWMRVQNDEDFRIKSN